MSVWIPEDVHCPQWHKFLDTSLCQGIQMIPLWPGVTRRCVACPHYSCFCLLRLHLQQEFTTQILTVTAVSVWIFSDHSGLLHLLFLKVRWIKEHWPLMCPVDSSLHSVTPRTCKVQLGNVSGHNNVNVLHRCHVDSKSTCWNLIGTLITYHLLLLEIWLMSFYT